MTAKKEKQIYGTPVRFLETGWRFNNATEVAEVLNVDVEKVYSHLQGLRPTVSGWHLEFIKPCPRK